MSQAYNAPFAAIYNARWANFARQAAPRIADFYAAHLPDITPVLDLCCGAGHLALHLLERGYRVVGLDLSESMLNYARQNTAPYVENGRATFICGDAANFRLEQRFGLVVSTFDSLNHLPDEAALRSCFLSAAAVCDGYFIFDLNTRRGLERWNNVQVEENQELSLITRGVYDGQSDKAWTRISGFIRRPDGLYHRFEETVYNTVFEIKSVQTMLLESGWRAAHCARLEDLSTPLDDPEQESRVFFVARK